MFAAVTAFFSMLGPSSGGASGAAVEFGAEYLAGIVLMFVGVIVVSGYP